MNILLRRVALALVLLLLAAYAVVVLRGPNGLTALAARRQEISELQVTNANLRAEIERKRERIHRLKHDRATQDLEIRDKLKLVKPGDQQVIVDGPAPASPASRASCQIEPILSLLLEKSEPHDGSSLVASSGDSLTSIRSPAIDFN